MFPSLSAAIRLLRLDKPIGIWLLLFPCWWGVLAYSSTIPYKTLGIFTLGAVLMRSAGCVMNDLADRNIDMQVARTSSRPLASGEITQSQAILLLVLLLIGALGVAISLGQDIVLLGALWLPLVAAYPFMKRYTWWPQAFLGITFGAGSLFGMVAVTGGIHLTGLMLYAASICWVIGYDTIYACQDRKDDARIGIKSTALLFGAQVRLAVGLFYTCTAIILCWVAWTNMQHLLTLPLICMANLVLGWQVLSLAPSHPAVCAKLFRANIWVGIFVTLAMIPT